jgi:SAM-dependent methyltransferase
MHSESYHSHQVKLAEYLRQKTNAVVQSGPFAGMILPADHTWGNGSDISSKMLGFYEQELHGCLEEAIARKHDRILNVGCAEGYYAIGMAMRSAGSQILAFDIDERALEVCRHYASVNRVEGRVQTMEGLRAGELEAHLKDADHAFLMIDCEGAEVDLLDPNTSPSLRFSTLLVECHDFANPLITGTLTERLSPSHRITLLNEGARDPNTSPILAELSNSYRWMAMDEGRPRSMHWIHAVPLARKRPAPDPFFSAAPVSE